jgi:lipopolysaccharide transport system permease protein
MERIIEHRRKRLTEELREVARSAGLIRTLALREWRIKYAQTRMGLVWAVLPVALYTGVYSFFFSYVLRVEAPLPYPLIALSGLPGWNYCKDIIYQAGPSIQQEQALLKKSYLPKLIIPLYKSLLGLAELLISLLLLLVVLVLLGRGVSANAWALPLIVAANWVTGLSVALWVSALSGRHRDLYHLTAAALNIGIWFTPVFYLPELLPAAYSHYLFLNPMAGILGWYRWALLGLAPPPPLAWAGLALALLLFLSGLRYFFDKQHELIDNS